MVGWTCCGFFFLLKAVQFNPFLSLSLVAKSFEVLWLLRSNTINVRLNRSCLFRDLLSREGYEIVIAIGVSCLRFRNQARRRLDHWTRERYLVLKTCLKELTDSLHIRNRYDYLN